jgi:hypothetical protein
MDVQWHRGVGVEPVPGLTHLGIGASRASGVVRRRSSIMRSTRSALDDMRRRTKKTGQCYAMPCYLGASMSKYSIDSHDAFARSWTALHHDHGRDHDHHYDHHSHGDNAERHRPRGYLQHPVRSFHNAIKGPAGRQRLMAGGASAVR